MICWSKLMDASQNKCVMCAWSELESEEGSLARTAAEEWEDVTV